MTSIFLIADLINKDITLRRFANQNNRWMAEFENADIKDKSMLLSAYGNGLTPEAALIDYINQIAKKTIIFNGLNAERRTEFTMPKDLCL